MASRQITAGNSIKLRTRFRDDAGGPSEATGVQLAIYEPDIEDFNHSNLYAFVTDPVYLGEGIYEYEFDVPECADTGDWTDVWSGIVNCQVVEGEFNFEVYGAGEVEEIGNQLYVNNLIEVTLGSGIMATDGTFLEDEYTFQFATTISPAYTNLRKVKLEVGGYVQNVPSLTIMSAILEASIEAGQMTFSTTQNTNFFQHARREWVTCRTALSLLDNITGTSLRAKQLGDLRVEYDSNAIMKTMDRIMSCLDKWEPQLLAAGYAKASQQPQGVVKGEYDPDRPAIGRLWADTDNTSISSPESASNYKDRDDSVSRRHQNVFKRNKRWW